MDHNIRFIESGEHYKNKKYITYEFRLCSFCVFGFCIFVVGGFFGWFISQYFNGTGKLTSGSSDS